MQVKKCGPSPLFITGEAIPGLLGPVLVFPEQKDMLETIH